MSTALPLNDAAGRVREADWIEAAKFELLVKGISGSHLAALVVLILLNGLIFGHVPLWQQVLWVAFCLGVSVMRYRFVARYRNHIAMQPVSAHVDYMRETRWFWPVYAAMWAAGSWLFVGRLPPERDVVCWMLVAGVAAVGVSWVSVDRKTVQSYLITYLLLVSAGVSVRALWGGPDADSPFNLWLPGLLAGYWLVLLKVSSILNELYTRSIDLRYHNALLVESLRHKTQIAQEAVDFKDRFLAGAAHDLKQPVNALGIYAEWLTQEPTLVDELGPKILQATRAINTLFDSMFDLVKLDAARFDVNLGAVDVGVLLSDLEVQMRPLALQKGLRLRVRPFSGRLWTDRVMLQRVLANLVANAVRYTHQGGVLLGVRRRSGSRICFEVWDTGVGISEDEQQRVFSDFYKVQTAGTQEGFGLGLAIVSRLADRLGCNVAVRSRLGRGTVFSVTLPPDAVINAPIGRSLARSEWSASGS